MSYKEKGLGSIAFDFLDKEDRIFHVKDAYEIEFQVVCYNDVVELIDILNSFYEKTKAERDSFFSCIKDIEKLMGHNIHDKD